MSTTRHKQAKTKDKMARGAAEWSGQGGGARGGVKEHRRLEMTAPVALAGRDDATELKRCVRTGRSCGCEQAR